MSWYSTVYYGHAQEGVWTRTVCEVYNASVYLSM